MSDTPRTEAAIAASDGQWSFTLRDLAQDMERELASKDAQADEIYKIYKAALDLAAKLESELEQERQERKQADLDALRALGERNDAGAELAVWKHEAKRLEAELAKFDETAIEWWCEYQDLKAKAREP